ncbi:MAG: plasmid encoded RepA protein [Treponema sp.]|nr:plasmid encoded RepA protein [Treponema sp.]
MGRKRIESESTSLIPIDNSTTELFQSFKNETHTPALYMSYIPSFFTTASLPFKNVNKTTFTRKGSQGVTLTLTSPTNVPYGKYGRLLLSVLTTHAVLSKEKNIPVMIEYKSLADLLKELQLPKQRGKEIKEQLECFKNAAFCFEQRVETLKAAYLFEDLMEKPYPKEDVLVETVTTGNIRFTTGVQYQKVTDIAEKNGSWFGNFKILLSGEFASFCQEHAVPINYTVYKEISSAAGKDIYAWLVYRNNGLKDKVFIPRDKLVEQFMPVSDEADRKILSVNYSRIIDEIRNIQEKYYPELKVDLSSSAGITLFKSPTPILKDDTRYALITSTI